VLLRCVRLNFAHNEIPINATANRRLGKFENDVCRMIGKAVSMRHGLDPCPYFASSCCLLTYSEHNFSGCLSALVCVFDLWRKPKS